MLIQEPNSTGILPGMSRTLNGVCLSDAIKQ